MRFDSTSWTGVVLTGGRSSRMGSDKASLPWRGKPLLEHLCTVLRAAGAQRVVVSGPHTGSGYDTVPDPIPGMGPLGGVFGVVQQLPDGGTTLLVPVDMPKLSPATLRHLSNAPAAASVHYHQHVLPLRLHVDGMLREWLERLITTTETPAQRSLSTLHAALGGIEIDLDVQGAQEMINVNTPEQWEVVRA